MSVWAHSAVLSDTHSHVPLPSLNAILWATTCLLSWLWRRLTMNEVKDEGSRGNCYGIANIRTKWDRILISWQLTNSAALKLCTAQDFALCVQGGGLEGVRPGITARSHTCMLWALCRDFAFITHGMDLNTFLDEGGFAHPMFSWAQEAGSLLCCNINIAFAVHVLRTLPSDWKLNMTFAILC